jgi:hypothetical protein
MPRDLRPAKKPYSPPSLVVLDPRAAKEKLEAEEDSKDVALQEMLSICNERINRRKPTVIS